ncbi:MAG: type I restriction-modification system subunit M [Planctomycetia bacterium]|nr:type I restriction-modification system subunit M [Planctomycetia bacterium]
MVVKKSKLYSFLWSSCRRLRGSMDVGRFKDYVLVLLCVKYAGDKYTSGSSAPIVVPPDAGFKDLVALKGRPDIGARINQEIVARLAADNRLSDLPDFDDACLGVGPEKVDRLSALIAIFENEALDFSTTLPEHDDLLGGAYEYLLRYCGMENGKNSGQPHTPAEVSRVMAQVLGVGEGATEATTAYDPTFGFGSPLLRLAIDARRKPLLYGQARDSASSGLAQLHLRLQHGAIANIAVGNTLADPQFKDGDKLKTFDFVVADPLLHGDCWRCGIDPALDPYQRFRPFGTPPEKGGGYAYLLHVVHSLNGTGRGACIMPQRALSRGARGSAEADIRWALIRKGLISGIIGLPPNLFFGTGISACIVIVDKRGAHARKGVFMIDAGASFVKDGLKNRLREQDLQRIVDVFHDRLEIPGYSRLVATHEIARADYNLSLQHHINGRPTRGFRNVAGSLPRAVPGVDVDALRHYWSAFSQLGQASLSNRLDAPPESSS